MYLDFIIFIVSYFFAIFSTVGYGLISEKVMGIKKYQLNMGFIGLIGVLVLISYSYLTHYFLPHGTTHNSIVNLLGLVFFLFFSKSRKKEILLFIIVFTILLLAFLVFKTHDDFPYYHFPYTVHLTENTTIFGIGLLNYGLRTPSSIFFLNSLFYLPFIKFYLFQIGAILFFGFSILILLEDIKKNIKLNQINSNFFLKIFSLCFILIFFYRIQEHGTDRSAQILILLFIIELINIRENYNLFNINITKIIILITLIVGLKLFFLLYFIFIIPFIYYLYKDKKLKLFNSIFTNKFFFISIISFTLYSLTYFTNTGCFFYPVTFSCFENFSWSIDIEEVKRLKLHYENWSKAGAGAGYENTDKANYVASLNWLSNWIDKYFFNKVSDFVLGIMFLGFVMCCFFVRKRNFHLKENLNFKFYYLTILLLFFEWFFNHPALRYGGYCIIALLFFLPFSFVINKYLSLEKIALKVSIIIFIAFIIFAIRNIVRIDHEVKFYNYELSNKPYYYLDEHHFRIQKKIKSLITEYNNCKFKDNCELSGSKKIISKFGKYIVTQSDK